MGLTRAAAVRIRGTRKNSEMVITIDGPAGAGKSTVSRALAERLGYEFLDTGAMYRAVTLDGIREGVDWASDSEVAQRMENVQIRIDGEQIWLNGQQVTEAIRTSDVTEQVHWAADHRLVRAHLVILQRQAAEGKNIVSEGRDQGTLVFPNAICKVFLTASAEERAQRRLEELRRRGESVSFDRVLEQQQLRDKRDQSREVGPLVAADDAIPVQTDGLTQNQVVDRLERLVRDQIETDTSNA